MIQRLRIRTLKTLLTKASVQVDNQPTAFLRSHAMSRVAGDGGRPLARMGDAGLCHFGPTAMRLAMMIEPERGR